MSNSAAESRPESSSVPGSAPGAVAEVPIRDDVIRLGQFLKLADLAEDGAQARDLIADGEVRVNGEVEVRRGRQLVRGDVVAVSLPTGEESAKVG